MPSYPCKHPTCTAYLPERGYCAEHAHHAKADAGQRHRFYDEHQRDAEAKAFYASAEWQRARARKLATNPVCERCLIVFADTVHHVVPLKRCTPAERTAQSNLLSLCSPCHNTVEAEARKDRACS